jgi:DNA modification methylase
VLDPFGGSNVTGAAAMALGRRRVAADLDLDCISGSLGRFAGVPVRVTTGGVHDPLEIFGLRPADV